MDLVHALFLGASVASLVWLVVEHRHLMRAARRRVPDAPEPARYPPLTVVRPVRGLDVDVEHNAGALLGAHYPGPLEILFVFDDADDAGVPLYRALVAQHLAAHPEARVRILFCGLPPP